MNPTVVLKRPVISEKSTLLGGQNKYTFEVAREANKLQIKDAVQKVFKVDVVDVNVINVPGKMRRVGKFHGMTAPHRKAVVTLRKGQRIEIFEGV